MAVHPQVEALLEVLVAAGRPSSRSLPLAEGRRNFAELFASFADTEEVAAVEDLRIGGAGAEPDPEPGPGPGRAAGIPVQLYRPASPWPGAGRPPIVAFFHGGGWVFGGIETHDSLCRSLANASGAVVASIGYHLAPEHPYPAALDDCVAATRWLHDRAAGLGCDPSRLVVAGDSSGGTLAAAVALRTRDEGGPPVAFQVLLYPALDPTMASASYREHADDPFLSKDEMAWYWSRYLGPDADARLEPFAAPARAKDLRGLPPGVVVTAENDPLRDEGEAYANRLSAAGSTTTLLRKEGMVHGFMSMGRYLDDAHVAMGKVGSRIAAALA